MPLPTSLPAAAVVLVFLAPGLLFELGLSRRLSYLRRSVPDRLLRFVAWSLLWDALLFPVGVLIGRRWPSEVDAVGWLDVVVLWAATLAMTALPYAVGAFVGSSRWGAKDVVFGSDPAPLAWHLVWADVRARTKTEDVYIRAHLREADRWVAGVWVTASDEPDDLFLSPRLECDETTGVIATDPSTRAPIPVGWGVWLRASDLDQVEVQ